MSGGLQYLIILAVLSAAILFVTQPLRKAVSAQKLGAGSELAELEAAREAKYRELRDAELDHSTGKLSDEDYEALDRTLRGEAVEIMHEIDRATIDEP